MAVAAKLDPISGPVPRDKFKELIDAPCGQALREIRKFDPLYGRAKGETLTWEVKLTRTVEEEGYATVEASSQEEADQLAEELDNNEIYWEPEDGFETGEVVSVKPLQK